MKTKTFWLGAVSLLIFCGVSAWADGVSAKAQAKIDRYIDLAKLIAADPEVIKAVAAQNTQLPAGYAEMTQEKWAALPDSDPFVRAFTKNPAAGVLKGKITTNVSEGFISDALGLKVAFIGKTSNWCHKGKPKHDVPMTGQTWQGKLELDKSSGVMEVQIAVPVVQEGKAIGSLVLGVSLEAFTAD